MVRFFGFSSLPPLVFPVLVLVAYVQILISVETDRETIYDKVSIKSGDGERQRWCGVESIGELEFDELDRTWRYPAQCTEFHKFDAASARKVIAGHDIFFLGNSVSRRLLYATAHILGGKNATYNHSPFATEIVQDVGSHSMFEVGVNSTGHCSAQYSCASNAFEIQPSAWNISDTAFAMFNCANKSDWLTSRQNKNSVLSLGFLFTATPVLRVVDRFLELWASLDEQSFPTSALDNYDVLVVQVLVLDLNEEKYFEGIIRSLNALVQRREALGRRLRVVLWGSPHNFATLLDAATVGALLKNALWSRVKEAGIKVLDVTSSTAQASDLMLGQHQQGNLHHFMDFTRLMIADNLINTLAQIL